MPSLIDRIDSYAARKPVAKANKSLSLSGDGWLFGGYGSSANRDLRADEWGAAQAAVTVTEIQRAIKFWQQFLGGMTWHIYNGANDAILCSSTDRKTPTGAGAMWFNAIQRFAQVWKHDFFESIAFSDWVYGETYIGKLRNMVQTADFMWLNPLVTEPDILQGKIRGYRYSGDEGYYFLQTQEVAYRIAQRHSFDDLRGSSPVLSAIKKINITENAYNSLISYYRNNMQLGGIVSGKPATEGAWSVDGATLDEIKTDMQRNHKGVTDAWRWFFNNAPLDVHQFEQVDLQKNFSIVEPLRKQVMMAMGVPPVLAGDPTDATYENTDDSLKNWYKTDGIPYGRKIEKFINSDLLIEVEPNTDIYFGFDYAPYETESPETVSTDFTAGYIDITVSQKERGYEVDKALEGVYVINGIPMHRDIIVQIAKTVPPQFAQPAPAPLLPAPAQPEIPLAGTQDAGDTGVTEDTVTDSEPVLSLETEKHIHTHDIEVETWDYTPDKARKELAAWQRHVKAKHSRPFEPRYTRGDIADVVTSGLASGADMIPVFDSAFALLPQSLDSLKAAFIAVFDAIQADDELTATKSLQSIRLDFEGRFADVLSDIRNGNVDNRRRAGDILRQLIRTFGYQAYVQGLQDGGVMDAPSEDDEAEIASLRSAQSTFVSNITRVLMGEGGANDSPSTGKPDMWWRGSIQPFYNAGLSSAQANGLYEWVLGRTEKHCRDCPRLNKQRHRLRHWKRKNLFAGTVGQATECGGWECDCKLLPAAGKAQGSF